MKKSDIKRKVWERTKEEMKIAIIEQAKREDMISYSKLLNYIKSLKLNIEEIDHRSIMAEMLGEISLAEDKAGRGMLSALVVHKTGDREPGQGFLTMQKFSVEISLIKQSVGLEKSIEFIAIGQSIELYGRQISEEENG